jgi:hypothetical protein
MNSDCLEIKIFDDAAQKLLARETWDLSSMTLFQKVCGNSADISIGNVRHLLAWECGLAGWEDLVNAEPIVQRIAVMLLRDRSLNDTGFGLYGFQTTMERLLALREQRKVLIESKDVIKNVISWLDANIENTKGVNQKFCAYTTERIIEQEVAEISRGVLFVSALLCGFKIGFSGSSGIPRISMSEKSLKKAYKRIKNITYQDRCAS